MTRMFLLIFSCILIFVLSSCQILKDTQVRRYVQLVQVVQPKNVGFGSAVVIKKGYLLSAAHIFEDSLSDPATTIIIAKNRKIVPAKIIKIDLVADLALLEADVDCPCAPLATFLPNQDDDVVVVGFPYPTQIKVQVLTHGQFQGMQVNDGKQKLLGAVSAQAAPGSSGGGAFYIEDLKYELFGIVSAVHYAGDSHPAITITFIIPPITIHNFLENVFSSTEPSSFESVFMVSP